jgi:hypothetical protein
VPVGVDQTRHRDHAAAVDGLRLRRGDRWSDVGDAFTLDEDIALDERLRRLVHRQQMRVADQVGAHGGFYHYPACRAEAA